MVPVGLTLQPEEAYLDLLGGLIAEDVDYYEVAPETMWRADEEGALHDNGFRRAFASIGRRTRRPFVAHGVGFSVGSSGGKEATRQALWMERLRADQRDFGFLWYTDHLGATSPGGLAMTLPMALPMTARSAAVVRRSLRLMQSIVPDVGVENTALYHMPGDPIDEPAFLCSVLRAPRTWLLLDLHNVFTMSQNMGFEPMDYFDRLDLSRVIEIHVSGGSYSDPAWLPSGRMMRLDAHDSAIPDEVFSYLQFIAPRCKNLRGVTLERMEGTVSEVDVPLLREEIKKIRRILKGARKSAPGQRKRAREKSAREAPAARRGADEDGERMTALLVARLRFERLLQGSREASAWFERDPAAFSAAFRRYHEGVPPTAFFPPQEAALFLEWKRLDDARSVRDEFRGRRAQPIACTHH